MIPPKPPPCLQAAIEYQERGWSPVALCPADHVEVDRPHRAACTAPGETPLWPWVAYQQRRASARELHVYWNRNRHANVGVVVGPVSELLAIAVEGPEGEAWLSQLGEQLPETWEFQTPAGGRRLLYALPEGATVAAAVLPGGRRLGAGECLSMPPSRHRDGGVLCWRPGHRPGDRLLAAAPGWLLGETGSGPFPLPSPFPFPPEVATKPGPKEVEDKREREKVEVDREREGEREGERVETDDLVSSQLRIISLNQIDRAAVSWLWPGWIPRGKLTVLDGDPGLGKSTMLLDLAARVTRGMAMPDAALPPLVPVPLPVPESPEKSPDLLPMEENRERERERERGKTPSSVILLTAEDSLSDTVRPRLEAAGADLARVHTFTADGERPLVIPRDLRLLEVVVRKTESRLVIFDPFLAYLEKGVDSCKEQHVRHCLWRLAGLAERTECAVVLLRHLNKGRRGKALYRGGGSIGIIGTARAGLLVAPDPESPGHRILASTKSNLGPLPASLRFMLEDAGPGTCRVVWCGPSEHGADDLVAPADLEESVSLREACEFLHGLLAGGPLPADECLRQARRARLSERTLRRAKIRLHIRSIRTPGTGAVRWLWSLPTHLLNGVAISREVLSP